MLNKGTAVVGNPDHYNPTASVNGAVAMVTLYGPRGGEIGSAIIDERNAREIIARLQSRLEGRSQS